MLYTLIMRRTKDLLRKLTLPPAILLLISAVAPAVCAVLCDAHICCPTEKAVAAKPACSHCPTPSKKDQTAKSSKPCCELISAPHGPIAKIERSLPPVMAAILPAAEIDVEVQPISNPEPTIWRSDHGPPGPHIEGHSSRAPPIV